MSLQEKADQITLNRFRSKAFEEGMGTLVQEIELALQWKRPSILLAIHRSKTARLGAQRYLEKKLANNNKRVSHIAVQSTRPDVIKTICESPNLENMVFFVSGIENADLVSDGKVYRALNMRRELLVEKHICVVFWLSESEAENLPRLAPDFWAFRHRVVEFAPKRGTRKQFIPAGLFLWKEQLPWMESNAQKAKLEYYEKFLAELPRQESAVSARIEAILIAAQFSWLLNDLKKFSGLLKSGLQLLEKYTIPEYQAWILNAQGIGLYEQGNKTAASVKFSEALSHDPDNCAIIMNTSISAHGLGKNRAAILTGRRSIKKCHDNYHLWQVLSYLYLSMGQYENAIEAMTVARDGNPGNPAIDYSLATCYYKNDMLAECARELAIAVKKSPPHSAIQTSCADALGGKTQDTVQQLKLAIKNGEISKHDILRDVNLHFLVNIQEFMVS